MSQQLDLIRSLTDPIGDLGGRWMLHPDTIGGCKEWGYPNGYAYYVVGRGGVLGDVDADVVTSAFAFFAPDLVRKMWEAGVTVEGAQASATRYARGCADFGQVRLADFAASARLAELAERVVVKVPSPGLSLFAGWRSLPLPDAPAGRAYMLLHLLRELRGCLHIVACVATGVSARDAVLLAAHGGEEAAVRFGWSGPFDAADPAAVAARAAAEDLTDQLTSAVYASALTTDELVELTDLVIAARAHMTPN